MSRTITLRRENRDLISLSAHPIVQALGYIRPDDLYIGELKYFGLIKPVIITDDDYYISNPDYIDAALQLGEKNIDVVVIEGASINDIIRLINFESRLAYRASKTLLYKIIKVLQEHLWNTPEGRVWAETIEGENIDKKIGLIVGYSGSTVALVKSIGKKDPTLLDRIDDPDGDMTLTKAMNQLKAEEDLNKRNDNYANERFTNLPPGYDPELEELTGDDVEPDGDGGDGEPEFDSIGGTLEKDPPKAKNKKPAPIKIPCDAQLTGFSVGFGKYGDFSLNLDNGTPAILLNDQFAGLVGITSKQTNDLKEGLHFVIQNAEVGWSFQVIATRISKLINTQEVDSKQA
ncbi:MAG: hypothetical protein WC716_06865 [Chitinophagaceae bacterium]|jgi:hypothetical protein